MVENDLCAEIGEVIDQAVLILSKFPRGYVPQDGAH